MRQGQQGAASHGETIALRTAQLNWLDSTGGAANPGDADPKSLVGSTLDVLTADIEA